MLYLRVLSHLNSLTREPGIWEMAAPAHAAKHKTMAAALNAFKAELTVKAKGPAPQPKLLPRKYDSAAAGDGPATARRPCGNRHGGPACSSRSFGRPGCYRKR